MEQHIEKLFDLSIVVFMVLTAVSVFFAYFNELNNIIEASPIIYENEKSKEFIEKQDSIKISGYDVLIQIVNMEDRIVELNNFTLIGEGHNSNLEIILEDNNFDEDKEYEFIYKKDDTGEIVGMEFVVVEESN
ncbi:MAG: hypothetical protein ACLFMO_01670 [Eubacteriales bacterium]